MLLVDEDLLNKAKSGDIQAYEELIKEHHIKIYNIALKAGGAKEFAVKVTQDIFVEAFQNIESIKTITDLKIYIYKKTGQKLMYFNNATG